MTTYIAPAGMLDRVRRLAKQQDGNLSLLVRRLLQQQLDAEPSPARRPTKRFANRLSASP